MSARTIRLRLSRAWVPLLPLAFASPARALAACTTATIASPWGLLALPPAPAPLRPCVQHIVDLARERGLELDAPVVATLEQAAKLLEMLPLGRLEEVRLAGGRLELVLDAGAEDGLEVRVPERVDFALDGDEDEDLLTRGHAVRIKSDERTLLVHRRLRFELGPEGVTGLVAGDIEVEAGPFHFDLAVRIEQRRGAVAHDKAGRILLATDDHGAPYKRAGRWVLQRYDRWLVLEAMGHRIEVGLTPCEPGPLNPDEQR